MNSANEGLSLGVPLLVVPQRGDQFLVGRRVEELGAGLMIHPAQATAEALQSAAKRILSEPSFAAGAKVLAQSMNEAGGYRRAADEVLAHVRKVAAKERALAAHAE
jgi:UDP:flavonoid glycosyltransferase YjiC (YdhE family)